MSDNTNSRVEWMISSDSHIIEPPDLWRERVDASFRERAPRVERDPKTGGDWWVIDGKRSMSFLGIQTGDRFEKDATELVTEARFDDVREAAYTPRRFLDENREDGVLGSVIYPSQALLAYSIDARLPSGRGRRCRLQRRARDASLASSNCCVELNPSES